MTEFYSPGQLAVIYPYLPREPKWFLLGGPADANEAQTAVAKWPGVRVVGVEPNPAAVAFQLANGWPEGHPLIQAALSDRDGTVLMHQSTETLRHSLRHFPEAGPAPENAAECTAVTWDALDGAYGPFEDAAVWMDVEGSELDALRGAEGLLRRGAVMLVNVELMDRDDYAVAKNRLVGEFLAAHGFRAVKDWNDSAPCRDRIYVGV